MASSDGLRARQVWVGLGANLGDARATLSQVLQQWKNEPGVTRLQVSSLWKSRPVDADGPDYLNAVAGWTSALSSHDLLDFLQAAEQRHGRTRPYFNAPRTLDLDLLMAGDECLQTPDLTLPHPRMHLRQFVLLPWLELAPQALWTDGRTVQAMAQALPDQGLAVSAGPGWWMDVSDGAAT